MANHKIEGTGNVTRAGFMERKREMEQNGKKRKKKVTCVCRSVTQLLRRVFSVIFFFFFFNLLLVENLIYFSVRKRVTLILQNLPRGRCDRDRHDDWNITMIYINVLNTHIHAHIHLWITLQLMDKNNPS